MNVSLKLVPPSTSIEENVSMFPKPSTTVPRLVSNVKPDVTKLPADKS